VNFKLKAALITVILSLALLLLGLSAGKYLLREEMEEVKNLTAQATEKVLILTRQNQILQEKLQQTLDQTSRIADRETQGWIWRDGQTYMGLLNIEQRVSLGRDLALKLQHIDMNSALAVFQLSLSDKLYQLELRLGTSQDINHGWRLNLRHLQPSWAVITLQSPYEDK
jgi:hypothetical protein